MADNVESNIVSRRRIQFEVGQLLQDAKSPQKLHQHPRAHDVPPSYSRAISSSQQQSDHSFTQSSLGNLPVTDAVQHTIVFPTNANAAAGIVPNTDAGRDAFVFTNYDGCFTDDGSPLIEQQGLSQPLLMRDRQLSLGHIAPATTAMSSQKVFSMASHHLLLQQQQLQQQIAQQQLHLQKLNVTLQDTTASHASGNRRDLKAQLSLSASSPLSGSSLSSQARAFMHASQGAQQPAFNPSSGAGGPLSLPHTSSRSGEHAPSTPTSATSLQQSPLHEAANASQLQANASQLETAMRHFLQFREASLQKLRLLEDENASLRSRLESERSASEMQPPPDFERRLADMKVEHDQHILDLQKHHANENIRSFAQGLEVGQQKLVSTLAVAQSQIAELRSAAAEKDRAVAQLRKDMQQRTEDVQQSVLAKTVQELSDTNTTMTTQISYREKYWLQELNAAKSKLSEAEAQHESLQHVHGSLQLKHSALECKYVRLMQIRNCLVSKLTSSLRIFHLRRAFDDWNRSLESMRVERMLETPQDFARVKQPLSFTSVSSGSMLHRPTIATEKSAADAPVSGSSAGTGAVTAAPPPSDFSSVSSFLEGLWASTNREPAGQLTVAPSSIVSNALAPLSFGAEPHSWPLQRLDKDFVNAAFQLAPAVVPSPHITNVGPEVAASRSASGLGKTSSRSQSTNQGDAAEFHV